MGKSYADAGTPGGTYLHFALITENAKTPNDDGGFLEWAVEESNLQPWD